MGASSFTSLSATRAVELPTACLAVANASVPAARKAHISRGRLGAATESAKRAERQAGVLYEKGAVDYLALLDAQRAALASEDGLARAQTDVALSLVGLYRAFGGGWAMENDRVSEAGTFAPLGHAQPLEGTPHVQ